jgi:hypothetical protein
MWRNIYNLLICDDFGKLWNLLGSTNTASKIITGSYLLLKYPFNEISPAKRENRETTIINHESHYERTHSCFHTHQCRRSNRLSETK